MRTSKPISTLSYNTDNFLNYKLNILLQQGKIDYFMYINHMPEEDEKKEHKHLFIVPSGLIDTNVLIKDLEEVDFYNDLPLKCMPFRNSKFSDWYLYALHDKDYLATKLEQRKYLYSEKDFTVSDIEYFTELVHTSDFTKYRAQRIFRSMVDAGYSFGAIVASGVLPPNLITQYKLMYNELIVLREASNTVLDTDTGRMRDSVF